ncbi:hypothetical protein C8F04DRAFT_1345269 [Mycena alexandri]|uniref:Uncharacterized protein n=1 Tax=Mycena alexandri TaxID=1745969 RepID=A0AAD6RY31_9AGAR|nr:hypothetical protein C8F04DRAFT_1345269 [Mycena alexandri]
MYVHAKSGNAASILFASVSHVIHILFSSVVFYFLFFPSSRFLHLQNSPTLCSAGPKLSQAAGTAALPRCALGIEFDVDWAPIVDTVAGSDSPYSFLRIPRGVVAGILVWRRVYNGHFTIDLGVRILTFPLYQYSWILHDLGLPPVRLLDKPFFFNKQQLHESVRVEWSKAKARKERWEEEVDLLHEEMKRVLHFLQWCALWWETRQGTRKMVVSQQLAAGLQAYTARQASDSSEDGLILQEGMAVFAQMMYEAPTAAEAAS